MNTDVMIPAIMNDNVPMIRLLMQYTMLGLNVLRAKDVEPKKAVVKRRLNNSYNNNSDDDWSDCSYSDEEERKPSAMEEENDAEVNEEGKVDEEESEYADSDEEEMKALRQFKNEGNMNTDEKRQNPLYPLLVSIRYGAQKAMSYFLDPERVKQDLAILITNNVSYAKQIEEAGGIDAVYERVFTLKYMKDESRLLLEAAAMTNNEELFKSLVSTLIDQGFDDKKLVRSSKFYPSLLQFCCNRKYFSIAIYLVKNYSFREKEVIYAYCDLAQTLTTMSVNIENNPRTGVRRGYFTMVSKQDPKDPKDPQDPLVLYNSIMQLIQCIPQEYKAKVLDKMMSQILTVNRPNLMEQLVKEIPAQLKEYGDIVSTVVKTKNDRAMRLLIECMGLKERLMKEDPRGYTVVELVMTQYLNDALERQRVAGNKRDDDKERRDQAARVEDEYAKIAKNSDIVNLYRLMKTEEGSIAKMLEIVLQASNGKKRELVSLEEVLDRVKRDSDDVSEQTVSNKRRCMRSYGNVNYSFSMNSRMNQMVMLETPEHKNI